MNITDPVTTLKGVGPRKAQALENAGIRNLGDMLSVLPSSYEDRRNPVSIDNLEDGKKFLVTAEVISKKTGSPYRKSPLTITVSDGTGKLRLIFFNGRFIENSLKKGIAYVFFGKVERYGGGFQMVHPDFALEGSKDDIRGIIPVYPDIKDVFPKQFFKWQRSILDSIEVLPEFIPESILEKYRVANFDYAVRNIHQPENRHQILAGRYRFIFQEFLMLETGLLYMKRQQYCGEGRRLCCKAGDLFMKDLPFSLTEGQIQAWKDIKEDMEGGGSMNRLLQGDVGSGKTVIAEMAMISAASSGVQSVIMAPTEILAKQHYGLLKEDFEKYGITTALLTSSVKGSEKQKVLEGIRLGDIQVVAATHAVLQDYVEFFDLGLVITDEQHRFGVNQRQLLSSKGSKVDTLVMTATPIPRTLAVILYGDLDISRIETMPAERKPVKTLGGREKDRNGIYSFVRKKLQEGGQCYVVAPLIEESEKIDVKSAEQLYSELSDFFSEYKVALIHGAMSREEKDSTMESFAKGRIQVLVSTVIIEVGINVRNASVMVIENAERFGLAQLHQLRGRVGRGDRQSWCFLISGKETDISKKRIETMEKTNSGFVVAEEDLKLRGPGEFLGLRQHGLPELKHASLIHHGEVLVKALEAARIIMNQDPQLTQEKNQGIKERLMDMFGQEMKINL